MAALATWSPAVSYSFVLPLTSANKTAADSTCSAISRSRSPRYAFNRAILHGPKKRGAGAPLSFHRRTGGLWNPRPPLASLAFAALGEALRYPDADPLQAVIHRRQRADVAGEAVFHLGGDAVRTERVGRLVCRRRHGARLGRRHHV